MSDVTPLDPAKVTIMADQLEAATDWCFNVTPDEAVMRIVITERERDRLAAENAALRGQVEAVRALHTQWSETDIEDLDPLIMCERLGDLLAQPTITTQESA